MTYLSLVIRNLGGNRFKRLPANFPSLSSKVFFHGNPLSCDCALRDALHADRGRASASALEGAVCHSPARQRGVDAKTLREKDFRGCEEAGNAIRQRILVYRVHGINRFVLILPDDADGDCASSSSSVLLHSGRRHHCPSQCKCTDGVVDCRNRKLAEVPDGFPADTTEM